MPTPPEHYRLTGPPVDGNAVENIASSDRQVRATAARAATLRACEDKDPAEDLADALRLILEDEWSTISPDSREALAVVAREL